MVGLALANRIADAALAEGRRLKLAPLAVVILDSGGNLVVAKREDGAGILRIDIAHAKAWGSLGMGFGSRELAERAHAGPAFISVLAAVSGGRIAPSPGGALIGDQAGPFLARSGFPATWASTMKPPPSWGFRASVSRPFQDCRSSAATRRARERRC